MRAEIDSSRRRPASRLPRSRSSRRSTRRSTSSASLVPEEVEVGTVDKFQGQEARVVLYSMASSSGDDVPRGLDFLLSRNRFNVAVSRAQCLVYLVCSPRLLEVDCRTIEHMRLANALCRFVELAVPVTSLTVRSPGGHIPATARAAAEPTRAAGVSGSPTWTSAAGCGSTRSRAISRTSRSRTCRRRGGGHPTTSGSSGGSGSRCASRSSTTARSSCVTWCSGLAAIAAGRRWSVAGDAGGRIEVDSVWIHLDPDQRPARIEGFGVYAEATGGRARVDAARAVRPPVHGTARRPGRCARATSTSTVT